MAATGASGWGRAPQTGHPERARRTAADWGHAPRDASERLRGGGGGVERRPLAAADRCLFISTPSVTAPPSGLYEGAKPDLLTVS
ncbi:hypothetical protein NDU88_008078 [Pleurodeles waltl]|uniref:Uncharacterized protein n=1 Tax=Pleurodeles waltl TaxID=8319 RepID=A0AAV7RTQ0_PLEWA|nr:hypothetical protein NDU88_008078 [Pleurodeles waltl]